MNEVSNFEFRKIPEVKRVRLMQTEFGKLFKDLGIEESMLEDLSDVDSVSLKQSKSYSEEECARVLGQIYKDITYIELESDKIAYIMSHQPLRALLKDAKMFAGE